MAQSKMHYAWWIMISSAVIALTVLGFMSNGVGIFFAPVCEDLGFSRSALSLYATILQLTMVVSLPIAGKLFPKINIRMLLSVSTIVFASGFFIMSQGHSLTYWYIAGFLQGVAGGFLIYLPIPILINNWFKSKTGFALGLALAFSGVGGAIINPINQYFISNFGWRTGYIALALISLAVSLPFFLFVVRFKPSDMGLQPYGAEEVKPGSVAPELTGVSASAALKTPSFYLMFFTGALLALTCNFNAHIPGYLTSIGYPAMVAATVASTVMIGVIVGKVSLGVLNDKFGLKFASTFGLLGGILAMVLMLLGQANVYLIYVGAFCYGLGYSMLTVEPPLILKAIFGQKEFSSIYSYITTTQAIVGAASVFIFGLIFDLTQSFAADLIIVGAAYLISLIFIFAALNFGKNLQSKKNTVEM
ncbi:MFS transporter [Desulfitobacterium chlororespirans]|uniref:Major Facilitator Superfamily protein n=1 Tax=Desulfitobacterium chlororespirans DSM 11544 TaxID=1121395 RepID=A0A1M7UZ05_9FIRM|nr:MFS transporter [Desulfitobacterium chlororespirans]SHN88271.1 Major Facilitator Superfamily protein [Desulfitobacterium chlororespirans DSM 11544]